VIKAGDLNRRITLQSRITAQDDGGRPSVAWADVVTVSAEVQDMLPSRGERIAEGLNVANRPCRIRIRYREGVSPDMRVLYRGRTLRIVSMPAELGHREGLEFMAEELTVEGQEP